MATLISTRAASGFPVFKPQGSGTMGVAWGSYTLAANPTAADVIQFCRVPKNATVLFGFIYGADIDTGTEALDMDIGWEANGVDAADPDGFGNLGVITGDVFATGNLVGPVAGIMYPFQGVLLTAGPKTFSEETILSAVVNAPANAGGTGILTMVAHYVVS